MFPTLDVPCGNQIVITLRHCQMLSYFDEYSVSRWPDGEIQQWPESNDVPNLEEEPAQPEPECGQL